MSVVVWDGHMLAADCQATRCGIASKVLKIRQLSSGEAVAWVGDQVKGLALLRWFREGANPDEWPEFQKKDDFTELIVVDNGNLVSFEEVPEPLIHDHSEPAAWGSGFATALAAMAMGADAKKAVEVTNELNVYCGFGVEARSSNGLSGILQQIRKI